MPLRFAGGVRTWGWICCSCWRSCCSAARRRSRRLTANRMTSGRKAAPGARRPTGRWCAATWSSIRCYPRTPSPTGPSHCEYKPTPSRGDAKGKPLSTFGSLTRRCGFDLFYRNFNCKGKLNPSWFPRYTCKLKSAKRAILHWVITISTNAHLARFCVGMFHLKGLCSPLNHKSNILTFHHFWMYGNDQIACLAEEPLNPGKVLPYPILWPLRASFISSLDEQIFPMKSGRCVSVFCWDANITQKKHTMPTNH